MIKNTKIKMIVFNRICFQWVLFLCDIKKYIIKHEILVMVNTFAAINKK